ncbi:hypothetical protein OH77DRAFT_1510607 [Trametes cingulata]|nr:hypothetical protein OH77DRAFT_1510607 [Trametes cingulata]
MPAPANTRARTAKSTKKPATATQKVTAAAKGSRKRSLRDENNQSESVNSEGPETTGGAPQVTAAQDPEPASESGRRYGTRLSNRERRPGVDIGLNWRELKEEQARRDAAEAEKSRDTEDRREARRAQREREEAGILRLASLEDERVRVDKEEEEYTRAQTERGYRAEAHAPPQGAAHQTAKAMHSQPLGTGTEDEDIVMQKSSPSHSEFDPLDDARNSSSPDTTGAGESDTEAHQRGVVEHGKVTAAKRKADARDKLLSKIANARRVQPLGNSESDAGAGQPPQPPKRSREETTSPGASQRPRKKATQPQSAFNADWLAASSAPRSRTGTPPLRLPSPTTRSLSRTISTSRLAVGGSNSRLGTAPPSPSPWHARITAALGSPIPGTSSPSNTDARATAVIPEEIIGGLRDEDVAVSRGKLASTRGRLGNARTAPPLDILPDDTGNSKHEEARKTRKSKRDVPEEDSKSASALPSWVKGVWPKLIASLCDYYGAQENPWVLDPPEPGEARFDDILQVLIDKLCPEKHHTVTTGEQLYKIACQAIYNWRRAFMTRVHSVVKKSVSDLTHSSNFKRLYAGRIAEGVAEWAMDANRFGGAAHWEKPDTAEDGRPAGALKSRYVLQTYAVHIKKTEQSIFTADIGPPRGALALACTAVEIAFKCYTSGAFRELADKFDYDAVGSIFKAWKEGSVDPIVEKPLRFQELRMRALEYVPEKPTERDTPASPSRHRRVVDPDSSP